MSQENVDMVRRSLKDVHLFWSLLDDYVVWDIRGFGTLDLDPVYVGRDAVIEGCRHYWGTWDEYEIDAEELTEIGPSVVVDVYERGRGRGSGAPFERRWTQVWTFHRGKLVRWEMFNDRTQALDAVGELE